MLVDGVSPSLPSQPALDQQCIPTIIVVHPLDPWSWFPISHARDTEAQQAGLQSSKAGEVWIMIEIKLETD